MGKHKSLQLFQLSWIQIESVKQQHNSNQSGKDNFFQNTWKQFPKRKTFCCQVFTAWLLDIKHKISIHWHTMTSVNLKQTSPFMYDPNPQQYAEAGEDGKVYHNSRHDLVALWMLRRRRYANKTERITCSMCFLLVVISAHMYGWVNAWDYRVRMWACLYVCVCVYIYIYICVCVCVCVCVHANS